MIISLAIPHCFGLEGPSCSVCINSVRLRLRPPGRAGLIGEKAWEQIGPEKAHNIHILTNIWDHCWGWKWGTCDWSWPHVAEVTVALQMWQERKSEKQREKEMWNISSSFLKAMKYHCGSSSSSIQILQHEKPLKRIYLCTYISLYKSLEKKKSKSNVLHANVIPDLGNSSSSETQLISVCKAATFLRQHEWDVL